MRQEKRSRWWLWKCDGPGCEVEAASHDSGQPPEGWLLIEPPAGWRGAPMAFHNQAHRDGWIDVSIANPPLAAEGVTE